MEIKNRYTSEKIGDFDIAPYVNLEGADLRDANLEGANLRYTNLEDIIINWNSHDLIAEILRQEAKEDLNKRSLAGLILVSRDLCWKDFLGMEHPEKEWSLETLKKYETDDNKMPAI